MMPRRRVAILRGSLRRITAPVFCLDAAAVAQEMGQAGRAEWRRVVVAPMLLVPSAAACVVRGVYSRALATGTPHEYSLLVPFNARAFGSTPLKGFLCGSAHIAAGQPELHGGTRREKGIVVSVAPAGPMSGADHQFRPGSSGAQHAHKRTRTSIAQRVAPMKAKFSFAKVELCKANEGMTHAHARATRTAAPPHHRPNAACRWQRAPRPVPRCPHRQCSCH